MELIAHPLHGAAGIEYAALETVIRLAADAPRYAREKPASAHRDGRAGVHHGKAAGAVGIFRLARMDAALPEQGRLLVARRAADRRAGELLESRHMRVDRAVLFGVGHRLREHAHRDSERFAELGVPLQRMYIEEHRAGSVAVIGHMDAPAGQIPDEPCVHRAEEKLAALGALSRAGDVIEDPAQLGAGEIGVDQKAGLFADLLFPAIGAQLLAQRRRPAALPDDRVIHGAARFLFPDDRRLALVGDADSGDVRGGKAARAECLRERFKLRIEDRHRIVLHPAGLRIDLREGVLRERHDLPVHIKNNGAGARRPLVKGDNVLAHGITSLIFAGNCI